MFCLPLSNSSTFWSSTNWSSQRSDIRLRSEDRRDIGLQIGRRTTDHQNRSVCFPSIKKAWPYYRKYLTQGATETIIHAFGSSRFDYCNSLLYMVYVVTKAKLRNNITPLLQSLHWLPIKEHIYISQYCCSPTRQFMVLLQHIYRSW